MCVCVASSRLTRATHTGQTAYIAGIVSTLLSGAVGYAVDAFKVESQLLALLPPQLKSDPSVLLCLVATAYGARAACFRFRNGNSQFIFSNGKKKQKIQIFCAFHHLG